MKKTKKKSILIILCSIFVISGFAVLGLTNPNNSVPAKAKIKNESFDNNDVVTLHDERKASDYIQPDNDIANEPDSNGRIIQIENNVVDESIYQFTEKSPQIVGNNISPNDCVLSDETYGLKNGDILVTSMNWAPSGLNIRIGFIDAEDKNIQYWGNVLQGGCYPNINEDRSGAAFIKISGLPASGKYHVAISALDDNSTPLEIAIMSYEIIQQ